MNTKILLVDDEERILQSFARTLSLGGYAVITAGDGRQGLLLYHQEQPDIVLLDLRMPGMSGLEALQAIREHDPEANVILCTAHGDKDAVIEALRAGASDFLPKPVDQVTLESTLRRAEERIHLKRELRASQDALWRHNERLEEEALQQTHMEQIEDLRWLSKTALHLLSLSGASEILDYAARALQEKLDDCFVWPLTRTSDGQGLRLGSLPGMDDSLLRKAIELIGFDPRNRVFDVIPELRQIYQQGELFQHAGGLAEFAASEVPRPVGEALAKLLGIHEVHTIGLVGRERVLGNLHIVARRPELIEEPELVESFAHQVALALEQATANQASKESEERFRTLVNVLPQFVSYTDKDLIYRFVNQTYQEKFEVTPDDIISRSLSDVIGETAFEEARPHIERALRGEQVRYHERLDYAIGGTRDIDGILVPDIAEDGQVQGYYAVLTDITPYMEIQAALRQTTERLRIQHEIDAAILAARSPEEIAWATLMRLHKLIPCHVAGIAEIDIARQCGRDLVVLMNGERGAEDSHWHSFSSVPRLIDAIQEGDVHHVEDISVVETKSLLEERLEAAGIRSYVSVPLLVQDTPQGTLNLASRTPGFFQSNHIEILEEIADSLAVSLQQAHLLEQTQRDAEQKALLLREVNHRVLNNLTAIMGILDMEQRRSLDNEADFRAALRDVISRIGGMVTVHRMLSSAQWAPLGLGQVVERVIHAALSSSPIQPHIEVVVDGPDDPLLVTSKQAITIALVINELTTNSIKYAFRDRPRGRIEVDIRSLEEENRIELTFRDDGPGMGGEAVAGEWRSVGINLVETNVRHILGGEVDFHNEGGVVASITFKRAPLESWVDQETQGGTSWP